ncbi:MAG: hypothetical protein BMS9Abin05_0920 [Rhodothermia bacterium]|nr:MAG: hypothetical protein BMS9Abin05_0920 [Rhodothermia bacterium]
MKRHSKNLIIALFFALPFSQLLTGCDAFSSGDSEAGDVTLTGQVLNVSSNNPVPGAFIQILPLDLLFEADAEGRFEAVVEIDSTMNLQIVASSDGFANSSVNILALANRLIEVPTLRLFQIALDDPVSGLASNILLLEQSASSIGVIESGSEEVAVIQFQVADSLGRPVILNKSTAVNFSFGVQPGGGEFLHPLNAETDNNGIVTVNLSSGTRAGVVQIIAETSVEGRLIRSIPVAISIHGGLPDQTHFSIGPDKKNFPGLLRYGLVDPIAVIVGDKYSNPVRQGTSVYFDTNFGVIGGSIQTDPDGRGTVNLMSANPLPADGIVLVAAESADDLENVVSGSTPVIMSGVPVVSVSPATAILDQTYLLTVVDQNGNPLVEGTTITVFVEGESVKAVGHTDVQLDDSVFLGGQLYEHVLRGPGITEFTFRAVSDINPLAPEIPEVEAITITVAGANGRIEIVLEPAGAPSTPSEGVSLTVEPDGRVVAKMELAQY